MTDVDDKSQPVHDDKGSLDHIDHLEPGVRVTDNNKHLSVSVAPITLTVSPNLPPRLKHVRSKSGPRQPSISIWPSFVLFAAPLQTDMILHLW